MGSYGVDDWLACVLCGRWETDVDFVDCDSVGGVLCPRCYWNGPPQFEYLQGLLRPSLSRELIDRIATFAYEFCTDRALAVRQRAASQEQEDVCVCPSCHPDWLGWHCKFCSRTIGLEEAV